MIGAVIGDIVGSRFEFNNYRDKNFDLWGRGCDFTDDSVMTVAVANAILFCNDAYRDLTEVTEAMMHSYGRAYPGRGYGGNFARWLKTKNPTPYGSFGNGSAMRVSAVSWSARNREECIAMAGKTAMPTHNHKEGVKGAEATALAGYMALHGADKAAIEKEMRKYYDLDFTIDGIRDTYQFNETCQETVPQAIKAFLESKDFEDCVRLSISVGGDSDTLAAIACGIAECYYGVTEEMRSKAMEFLPFQMRKIVEKFETKYGKKVI